MATPAGVIKYVNEHPEEIAAAMKDSGLADNAKDLEFLCMGNALTEQQCAEKIMDLPSEDIDRLKSYFAKADLLRSKFYVFYNAMDIVQENLAMKRAKEENAAAEMEYARQEQEKKDKAARAEQEEKDAVAQKEQDWEQEHADEVAAAWKMTGLKDNTDDLNQIEALNTLNESECVDKIRALPLADAERLWAYFDKDEKSAGPRRKFNNFAFCMNLVNGGRTMNAAMKQDGLYGEGPTPAEDMAKMSIKPSTGGY